MATPAWNGATNGQLPLATQINQFLGTHAITFVYTGTSQGSSTTLSGSATNSNGLYIAQTFTPGSAQTIQRWIFTLAVTGSPGPLTVTIRPDNAGAPSASILSTTLVPSAFVPGAAGQVSVPTAQTALTNATPYWFVFSAVGDASNFYAISRTTAGSGASTSVNGTSWSTQAYGLYYQRFDTSVIAPLAHTYEDTGARWTTLGHNANTSVSKLSEYNTAQNSGALQSVRSFTYSGADVTVVS